MSSIQEETLQILKNELTAKLEALKTQGLSVADQQSATSVLLEDFGARLQEATLAKAQAIAATSSSSTSSATSGSVTIYRNPRTSH